MECSLIWSVILVASFSIDISGYIFAVSEFIPHFIEEGVKSEESWISFKFWTIRFNVSFKDVGFKSASLKLSKRETEITYWFTGFIWWELNWGLAPFRGWRSKQLENKNAGLRITRWVGQKNGVQLRLQVWSSAHSLCSTHGSTCRSTCFLSWFVLWKLAYWRNSFPYLVECV